MELRYNNTLIMKLRIVLLTFHTIILLFLISAIIFSEEPDWPMYWLILFAIDFPVSLLAILLAFVSNVILPLKISFFASPFNDTLNFWCPLITFALAGSCWWYWLGGKISKSLG